MSDKQMSNTESVLGRMLGIVLHDLVHRTHGLPAILPQPEQVPGKGITLSIPKRLLDTQAFALRTRTDPITPDNVELVIGEPTEVPAADERTVRVSERGKEGTPFPGADLGAKMSDGGEPGAAQDEAVLGGIVALMHELVRRDKGEAPLLKVEHDDKSGKSAVAIRESSLPDQDCDVEIHGGNGAMIIVLSPQPA